jgi:hypothetical protein
MLGKSMKGQSSPNRLAVQWLSLVLSPLSVLAMLWLFHTWLPTGGISAATAPHRLKHPSITGANASTHHITGHVHLGGLSAQRGGERVTIYAGTQYSTTADSSGVYTITDIPAGTYLLTAKVESESACLFYDVEPVSRSVTIPPNAGDQNFFIVSVHVTDPAITGVILDASGVGIADVVVSTPGLPSVTTDASGRFQWWPVGCDRTYWVTPHKPGYTFEPASVALTTPIEGNLRFVGRSQRQATFLPLILRPQAAQN